MASNIPNKSTALAADTKAIQGVDKHFATLTSVTLAGTSYAPADLKAIFQAEIDATDALDQSRAQMSEQVATTRLARAKAFAVRQDLKAYVLGAYGAKAVQVLGDFGIGVPRSKVTKTALTKADAVVKAKATREARHTMGKRQKQSIKGAPVTPVPAEPPVQSAATAAAPATHS